MLNTKKTAIAAIIASGFVAAPASAAVYNIIGGDFFMDTITPAAVAFDDTTGLTLNINEGATAYQSTAELPTFPFFGSPVTTFTAAASSQTGVAGGGPAPSGTVADGGTVDMSSFFALWNGTEFNQGADASVTLLANGNYNLNWSSLIVGGSFDGKTGSWNMEISQVPVPAAVWLMGSGLVGLVGVARRRRAKV